MNYSEFTAAKMFLNKKLLNLMRHENKDYAQVGFPPQNYTVYPIKGKIFYSIHTNVFKIILKTILIEAIKKYPEKFGTGNAIDVLAAIYAVEPIFDFDDFVENVRKEQFCCVIENLNGLIRNEILRIDLFRKLDDNKGKKEFTGGVFHAFKHFSIKGQNLSTGSSTHDLYFPEMIISIIIESFFLKQRHQIDEHTSYSLVDLNEKYVLKFIFYFEEKTEVYFLKTVYKSKKKKEIATVDEL